MKNNKGIKQRRPISIFTIILFLIVIAVITLIVFGIRYLVITLKYKEYTDKMYTYDYAEMYDNKKATAVEDVTYKEVIKIVISSLRNTKDIDNLYFTTENNISKEDKWKKYAVSAGIIPENINLEEKAKKINTVMIITRAVQNILNIDISGISLNMSETKLARYTQDERNIISKAVTLELIKNKNSGLSNSKILKGELNKYIIELTEKYATVYYGTYKLENGDVVKQNINLVTDKEKLPSNYEDYPYIVDNIPKEIYELDYNILTKSAFQNPKRTYEIMGNLYMQTDELVVRYFNSILNVDYNTITYDKFLDSIKADVAYKIDENDIKEYVDYIKENKIKLEGSATPLLPIMYSNGEQYVIRTEIKFKVLSSDTNKNLLFGDEKYNITYNSKEITMYVDVPTGMTANSYSLRIYVDSMARHLAKANTSIKIEK